ncbi:unnamed protein product [Calicophoron daubneyi]|uniref:Uncharacterized protein n=1 Tax=Calicophoron daubneyi TaxID=300641 RepID=A0AAV2TCM6_CALDB
MQLHLPSNSGKPPLFRNPEAGDTHRVRTVPMCLRDQFTNLSRTLLSGYSMQWALNRTLTVVTMQQNIHVNAYKLASQSSVFRELLFKLNDQMTSVNESVSEKEKSELQNTSFCYNANLVKTCLGAVEKPGVVGQQPLMVFCAKPSSIEDLLFAIHFCHIGQCSIRGLTPNFNHDHYAQSDEDVACLSTEVIKCDPVPVNESITNSNEKIRAEAEEPLFWTSELLIRPHDSECSLSCGLRVARIYGLSKLRQLCLNYIQQRITTSNCWRFWRATLCPHNTHTMIAEDTDEEMISVDQKATQLVCDYIQYNFQEVMSQEKGSRKMQKADETSLDYTDMDVREMEYMFASDRLNVKSERDVVKAIERWLEEKERENKITTALNSAPRLLTNCIRIEHLDFDDIEKVYRNPYLRKHASRMNRTRPSNEGQQRSVRFASNRGLSIEHRTASQFTCLAAYRQARRRLFRVSRNLRTLGELVKNQNKCVGQALTNTALSDKVKTGSKYSRENEPRLPHEAIFLFGGWQNGTPCRNVCVFDARKQRWLNYGPTQNTADTSTSTRETDRVILPHALMSFGIAVVQNRYVYIAGGELLNTCTTPEVILFDFYNPEGSETSRGHQATTDHYGTGWTLCSPMHEARRDLVLVNVHNRRLYALGGDNNRTVLNTVEYYCMDELSQSMRKGWTQTTGMLIARGAPAADCVNQTIYVCGGYTESRMEALTNSCEALNLDTNQWTFIQPMTQARYYANAITVDNVLFVLGGGGENGSDGANRVPVAAGYSSTVERYDPKVGSWELMPPAQERADFAACLFEGELYCIGGGGEAFCTDDVERWRPWLPGPNERAGLDGEAQNTSGSDSLTEPSGPLWLVPQLNERETRSVSWTKSACLPFPIWGHRAVVIKGLDLVLPYLNRPKPEETKSTAAFREIDSAQCVQVDRRYVILVPEANEQTAESESGFNDRYDYEQWQWQEKMDSTVTFSKAVNSEQKTADSEANSGREDIELLDRDTVMSLED